MAFLPFFTWLVMASTEFMPNWAKASFFRVLLAIMTLLPPIWQAAQLALNTLAPLAASPSARAGRPKPTANIAIATNTIDNSFLNTVLLYSINTQQTTRTPCLDYSTLLQGVFY